jgi:hypothetical protein
VEDQRADPLHQLHNGDPFQFLVTKEQFANSPRQDLGSALAQLLMPPQEIPAASFPGRVGPTQQSKFAEALGFLMSGGNN